MDGIKVLFIALIGFIVGGGVVYVRWVILPRKRQEEAIKRAEVIIEEAKKEADRIKGDKLAEAQEEKLRLLREVEAEYERKRQELYRFDRSLREKEKLLTQRTEVLERRARELKQLERELKERESHLKSEMEEVEQKRQEAEKTLQELSGLTREEALQRLRDELMERARRESQELIREMRERARLQAEQEAKEIIVQAIQRSAVEHTAETSVTVVNLPNDEIKGRIIGREGRNIRAFEEATGVDLIIDDTPGAVTLSCFDPMRREVARVALEWLIQDGRIHPKHIEEMVAKAQKEVEEKVYQLGEQAAMEVNVAGIHPELLKFLGKLHYRTSYGQNVLRHSVEVARLAAMMAAELHLDARMAARAGLLHDIGKAIDRAAEGTHTELGLELVKRFKEPRPVQQAVSLHHESIEASSLIACLVQAADAISGSRPGARRDSLENYIRRLQTLEEIARGFEGVEKCYALQAGREIRIIVQPERMTDGDASQLAKEVASRIEQQLEYPGQIKVTVIREFRAHEFAR